MGVIRLIPRLPPNLPFETVCVFQSLFSSFLFGLFFFRRVACFSTFSFCTALSSGTRFPGLFSENMASHLFTFPNFFSGVFSPPWCRPCPPVPSPSPHLSDMAIALGFCFRHFCFLFSFHGPILRFCLFLFFPGLKTWSSNDPQPSDAGNSVSISLSFCASRLDDMLRD